MLLKMQESTAEPARAGMGLTRATSESVPLRDPPALHLTPPSPNATTGELLGLLTHTNPTVVAAATRALGCAGDQSVSPVLAGLLHHHDPVVSDAAEHALWMLWFRSGSASAQERVGRAVLQLQKECWRSACEALDRVIEHEPHYVEAWNQRAIARYLGGDCCGSIADCRQTLRMEPFHFGAMAGMGLGFAQLGRHVEAVQCYRAALRIHPRMDGIRQAIRELQSLHPVS